ncbi:katanin p80 WD40 repeat-containing subunit B1 homolog KTN80.2-like isoform X1 [Brassica napus]|uniref:katanin p80 WD40 repeat-containing subunit B1 homolog KTN80.2-like isoform X1 n=1 Tax=Brassica napus TaxID=3708 RepID=UPI002078FF54|nr:katanin p80 WD40 repeat-containing subunit B1 homolog KTN80.2-like isoform X1 [Brassica napus]
MAKRGYKLQEFLAHSANVNCLSIGKKTSRLLITGGDDYKVNLWAIGKPTSLMSLCGHTSAVDSLAFDSAEVLVLGGASSGLIKLWDLEEAKMVRAFTGHRSSCSAVEFHPFGEFLASGSNDTSLKIWDIRKKGCIQTYKGHTRDINTIKFSPDGRWVVTGGLDNAVKVWDLTAGKLIHDFKFHEGSIRSLDFHPLEFLLATGSADRTVKFWDLETFELIGSTRPEDTGVRSIKFHPDGRTLFCGLDDGLKVYSWEPVVCHDSVNMGWSTLGDLCISEGKLMGCSYYQNSVGIWVSDISQIEPYGIGSTDKKECVEKVLSVLNDQSSERVKSGARRSPSPDYETKEIKNIYIDSTGGNSTVADKPGSRSTSKVNATSTGQAGDKSFILHGDTGKDSSDSGKESITFSKTKPGMLLRPAHVRKTPSKQSVAVQSSTPKQSGSDGEKTLDTKTVLDSEESGRKPFDASDSIIKSITSKFEKALFPESPTDEAKSMLLKPPRVQRSPNTKYNETRWAVSVDSENLDSHQSGFEESRDADLPIELADDRGCNPTEEDTSDAIILSKPERVLTPEKTGDEQKGVESPGGSKESDSVKVVRGVKVVSGRTRSLVERFERRETITPSEEDKAASAATVQSTNSVEEEAKSASIPAVSTTPTQVMPVKLDEATNSTTVEAPVVSTRRPRSIPARVMPVVLGRDTNMSTDVPSVTLTGHDRTSAANLTSDESSVTSTRQSRSSPAPVMPVVLNQTTKMKSDDPPVTSTRPDRSSAANLTSDESPVSSRRQATSPAPVTPLILNRSRSTNMKPDEPHVIPRRPLRSSSTRIRPVMLNQTTNTHDERPVQSTRSARTSPARVIPMKLSQADDIPSYELPVALTRSARNSPVRAIPSKINQANNVTSDASHIRSRHRFSPTQTLATPSVIDQMADMTLDEAHITQTQPDYDISKQKEDPRISERENEDDISETLMQTHNEVLNTLQSRLTKLQIVRHFWERNDIKGAIMALKKLSDHSVQADVISILTDKPEILTLDLFSQLAPVLTGLLGSRTERPVSVSLEMLLKLVAVFGAVVQSNVSARRSVGVDLHAEERLQICQSCSAELQKVQKILPLLTRRGGLIARKAQELNLVLQTP